MKKLRTSLIWISLCLALTPAFLRGQDSPEATLKNNGLPAGTIREVLPHDAIVHIRFNQLYGDLLNLEKFAKATVPAKALPPDAQGLLQAEHPLLTILGMQTVQEPLTAEKIEQSFGLDAQRPFTITLYPGDPRRMFVLSVPMANPQVLTAFLKNVLHPKVWEAATLGDKSAVRVEFANAQPLPEVYIVCGEKDAYICGDRSLATALYFTPSTERLSADAFMNQTIQGLADQDITLVFNPSLIKPFLLGAQAFRPMVIPLIQGQRQSLLQKVPPPIRSRIDAQLREQMGVKNLDQLADYLECAIIATFNSICDVSAQKLTAFQGLSWALKLDAAYPQMTFRVYSHEFQPDQATAGIPLGPVRQAMTWLGKDFDIFTVEGQQQPPKTCPWFLAWLQQVQTLAAEKGLKSVFLERWQKLVENEKRPQPLETKVPWVLTTTASLNPLPKIRDFHTLEAYGQSLADNLALAGQKPIKLIAGKDTDFLADVFKQQTEDLNANYRAEAQFAKDLTGKTSFIRKVSRFHADALDAGIKKLVMENAYVTRSGLFGYDQHEFVNRKIFMAKKIDDFVVFYQDAHNSSWLSHLAAASDSSLSPAMTKLLNRVPEGANSVCMMRLLHRLPAGVDWLEGLEDLIHGELNDYLAQATKILTEAASPDAAREQLEALKTPFLVYSVNQDPDSKKVYCLLPGNVMFPRKKVTPILKDLFAEFAAKADQDGGGLVYTRVQPEVWECSIVQNTEAFSRLVSTVGNTLVDHYLGSPEKIQQLHQTVMTPGDGSAQNVQQAVFINPRLDFLPTPRQQQAAKPTQEIPARTAQATDNQVDLSAYYNASLTETWHGGGVGNNTLKSLPQGVQEFGGVKFDVRGIIQIAGQLAQEQLSVKFPKEVKGIVVGHKAERFHLLHAAGWASPDGTKIGNYVVHYANGETREIPIVYGEDVRDWWPQPNEPANDKLNPVWTGENTASQNGEPKVRLFKTTWQNPLADVEIQSIDYTSAMGPSAPFLIAITLE